VNSQNLIGSWSVTLLGAKLMKASTAKQFNKKLACPSASLLVRFNCQELAPEASSAITDHLENCDFCYCEMPLLAFYIPPRKAENLAPELPLNLRILAESLLGFGHPVKLAD
jgi:hypothetical protein